MAKYFADRNRIQKKIDDLVSADGKLADANTSLAQQNTDDLNKTKTTVKVDQAQKAVEPKNVYLLMEEATGIKAPLIRFVLVEMMSLVLEVGLFFTSPHMYKIEEEENKAYDEEEEKEPDPETDPTPPENKPSKKRGRPFGSKNKPKTAELHTSFDDLPSPDQTQAEPEVAQEAQETAPEAILETTVPSAPEETKGTVEVVPSIVEGSKPTKTDLLIDALFSNGSNPYLKDLGDASKESGVPPREAEEIFEWLQKKKYNGYVLVEFRNTKGKYYPNVTSEIAKNLAKEEL